MSTTVLTGDLTFTSLSPCDLSNCTKSEIKTYLTNTYDMYESIFTSIADESVFYKYPDRLRLPLIFYYGHTASVYVNKLILVDLMQPEERVNFDFECIFETGVDEMSWDETENYRMGGKFRWPSVKEVAEYRLKVRNFLIQVIDRTPLQLPVTPESPWWAVFMGMEHERIHLETSSVLIRQLPLSMVTKPAGWVYGPISCESEILENTMLPMEACSVTLGKPEDFPSYGWDNEYGTLKCNVPSFEASKYLITNAEMLDFVQGGGYSNPKYWTKESWEWVQFREARHPTFWTCDKGCRSGGGADLAHISHCEKTVARVSHGQNSHCNGHMTTDSNGHQGTSKGSTYRLRLMFDVVDLPLDLPVEVNYHEARAFCSWKGPGYRLPSEAEHHVIRGKQADVTEGVCCDVIYRNDTKSNLNLFYGSPTPVNLFPPTSAGFCDVFGNVWEWVEDHFNGLPGYKSHYIYDDFSAPCFDGRHHLIMGGSWISSGDEASRFARFAFRSHFFQHLGFRIATNKMTSKEQNNHARPIRKINTPIYMGNDRMETCENEDDQLVDTVDSTCQQYVNDSKLNIESLVEENYKEDKLDFVRQAEICASLFEKYGIATHRALHIGCGIDSGRLTFQLTKHFDEVLAQDVSSRLIAVCLKMQKMGRWDSGDTQYTARLDRDVKPDNATFKLLTWLPNEVGSFDFILATGLERLRNIKAWLVRVREILNSQGLLIICSESEDATKYLMDKYTKLMEQPIPGDNKNKQLMLTAWQHKQI